jgi:hypothetical protein
MIRSFKFVLGMCCLNLLALGNAQDGQAVIREALTKQWQVPHFKTVSTGEVSSDDPEVPASLLGQSTVTTSFVSPDKLWIHFENDDGTSDMLITNGLTFQKSDAEAWDELTNFPNPMAVPIEGAQALLEETLISSVEQLADEPVNGVPCWVYSYASTLRTIESQNKLWIDKTTGLPVQSEALTNLGNMQSTDQTQFDYQSTITIPTP